MYSPNYNLQSTIRRVLHIPLRTPSSVVRVSNINDSMMILKSAFRIK